MRRLKHNIKKGMTFVLSLAMVAGLVPAMSGGVNTVQAADQGTEPSVTAFATKDQLMTAFKPNADGSATNKGKLVFGKNSSDGVQEWYILGKDEGITGDNTIIFAASPIATGQTFNSSTGNKTYSYGAGTGYGDPAGSIEVFANHYGASDLRDALQTMATNTSYFTTVEQNLMNATSVTTNDKKNNVTYTTTDKLYALQGNNDNDKYLWAGTNDSTVLAMSSYWSNGSLFWLRSPFSYSFYKDNALAAEPKSYVHECYVAYQAAVQPATNLNLSSVLFASAATASSSDTAESETIASDTAMTLRLDGTSKDIGTVTYNTTTGDIKAVKGGTSQIVDLFVQGKDGTNDWFYSKRITGTDTVKASDIKTALTLSSDIDLAKCKIWLETTDSTENLIYAVNATEATIPLYVKTPGGSYITLEVKKNTTISTVKEKIFEKEGISVDEQQLWFAGTMLEDNMTLQDYSISKDSTLILRYVVKNVNVTINTPKGGQVLDTNATCSMNGIKSATLEWTDTDNNPVSGKANYYPWCYKAHVTLQPADGYVITDAAEVQINNNTAEEKTINTDGSISVTFCFDSTKDKLTGITAPAPITTGNGAAKTAGGLGLPSQVNISTAEGAVSKADVVWDLEKLAGGTYDPSCLTEQIFTVNGTVTLPEEVDNADNISLNLTIHVTVSAAGIVGAPTVNPAVGAYTENQLVTLTSSTEGAKIYYTTDGSVPTLSGGVPVGTTKEYTAAIAVTGTEGQSVTTTIKAIAVKSGMQDSGLEAFTYTIAIPAQKTVDYKILDGAGSTWKQNTEGTITIRGNGDFTKFIGVKVDGNTIDTKNYTAKEGSTIITLTADYLKTLPVGTHTFEIVWSDGSAGTSFTVSKNDSGSETPNDDDGNKDNNDNPNDNSNNNPTTVSDDKNKDISGSQSGNNQQVTAPKTGDNNHLVMWVTLFGVSLAGLLAVLYTRKKKDNE